MDTNRLNRSITLPLLTLYGLGTILGAGIYVLIGEVAATSGVFAPFAFVAAGILATFTALSYAELSSRFPVSAGEAIYIEKGLGVRWLSQVMGWAVIVIGITSSATIANGFVGYFQRYFSIHEYLILAVLILSLGMLASYGIMESVWVATVITLAEIFGLVLVIVVAFPTFDQVYDLSGKWLSTSDSSYIPMILAGMFLAFYAFIGFEDMVNVAEEVKTPERTIPKAIIIALVVSSLLYFVIAFVALTAVPVELLAESKAPLADIVAAKSVSWLPVMTVISLVAVINGALVQIIMVSRVIYGMADRGLAPVFLATVHPKRKTPLFATLLTTLVVLVLAIGFDLVTLAKMTSGMTLLIFALVNFSLVRIQKKYPNKKGVFTVPAYIPWLGFILNLGVLIYQWLA